MKSRVILISAMALVTLPVLADRFSAVRYSPNGDQLIVTMAYRGTNPDHDFSLRWGECKTEQGETTVSAEVLDSRSRDAARQSFSKTVNFELRDMPCRPARVVLRTAPRSIAEVRVPRAP